MIITDCTDQGFRCLRSRGVAISRGLAPLKRIKEPPFSKRARRQSNDILVDHDSGTQAYPLAPLRSMRLFR